MMDPHMAGFEKESLFSKALIECRRVHETFNSKTLRAALKIVCPEFVEGLYKCKPYARRLKFIGFEEWGQNPPPDDFDSFFRYGKVYESIDLNRGTYSIKDYDGRIGCAYFEICED